jgi:hypothetical protein
MQPVQTQGWRAPDRPVARPELGRPVGELPGAQHRVLAAHHGARQADLKGEGQGARQGAAALGVSLRGAAALKERYGHIEAEMGRFLEFLRALSVAFRQCAIPVTAGPGRCELKLGATWDAFGVLARSAVLRACAVPTTDARPPSSAPGRHGRWGDCQELGIASCPPVTAPRQAGLGAWAGSCTQHARVVIACQNRYPSSPTPQTSCPAHKASSKASYCQDAPPMATHFAAERHGGPDAGLRKSAIHV